MPLFTFNTAARKFIPLALKGEIADLDYCVDERGDIKKYGLFNCWLHANFKQHILWREGSAFNAEKKNLAEFLSQNMQGPYYMIQGYVNADATLSIVILKESDRQKFQQAYPQWQPYPEESAENAAILKLWREGGRVLGDQNLYDYAAP